MELKIFLSTTQNKESMHALYNRYKIINSHVAVSADYKIYEMVKTLYYVIHGFKTYGVVGKNYV